MDNRVLMDCGSAGWAGQRRAKGGNWDNCKNSNKKKDSYIKKEQFN